MFTLKQHELELHGFTYLWTCYSTELQVNFLFLMIFLKKQKIFIYSLDRERVREYKQRRSSGEGGADSLPSREPQRGTRLQDLRIMT